MPSDGRLRVRKARRLFSRDNRRALGICLFFAVVIVVGAGAVWQHAPTPVHRGTFAGNAVTQADDDLSTGSIIIVPILGNVCRKRLIDNATWRIREVGLVDCRIALNPNPGPMGWSASRVDVIRAGFYRR